MQRPARKSFPSVLVEIRELILRGDFAPGDWVTEESIASRLGISRTPVRQALPALAREGLLHPRETRGYVVRSFSEQEVHEAIDIRGALEGLAGRLAAERGVSPQALAELNACLAEGDTLFVDGVLPNDAEARYAAMNGRLHALIVRAAGSQVIDDALAHNAHVPFAAAAAVAFDRTAPDEMFDRLRYSHRQHHVIVQAMMAGQAARVETLLREHSQLVKESLNLLKARSPLTVRRPLGPRVNTRVEPALRN